MWCACLFKFAACFMLEVCRCSRGWWISVATKALDSIGPMLREWWLYSFNQLGNVRIQALHSHACGFIAHHGQSCSWTASWPVWSCRIAAAILRHPHWSALTLLLLQFQFHSRDSVISTNIVDWNSAIGQLHKKLPDVRVAHIMPLTLVVARQIFTQVWHIHSLNALHYTSLCTGFIPHVLSHSCSWWERMVSNRLGFLPTDACICQLAARCASGMYKARCCACRADPNGMLACCKPERPGGEAVCIRLSKTCIIWSYPSFHGTAISASEQLHFACWSYWGIAVPDCKTLLRAWSRKHMEFIWSLYIMWYSILHDKITFHVHTIYRDDKHNCKESLHIKCTTVQQGCFWWILKMSRKDMLGAGGSIFI